MARTGSALAIAVMLSVPAFAAEPEFYMTADRQQVGTEDTFRLDIVVGNAPEGSSVQFPATADIEILSRSESSQMSYSVGSGGAGVIKQLRKFSLVVRANRAGTITIPPAGLQTPGKLYKSEPITIDVQKGRLGPDPKQQRRQAANPFGFPPGFPPGFPNLGDDDPFGGGNPFEDQDVNVPRSDSDLFLRASLDKTEAYVGEQVMYTIVIYSQLDLSSVDSVSMPKLEGFWTQDLQSPSQLSPEQRTVNGVRYRAYVLRQKALFAMKPGEATIEPSEADINTGFAFSVHRLHRKSNPLTLKVKPLPPGGNGVTNVGRWRLSAQATQTDLTLGDPLQIKVTVEGRGNLQSVQVPALQPPPGLKAFDPQTTEKPTVTKSLVGGARTIEYVLVPQQTGVFTIPGLTLGYFDPESKHYEESRTDPMTITVRASATGQTAIGPATTQQPGNPAPEAGPKNQLAAGGLKQLRHTAHFSTPQQPLWRQPAFIPLTVAPVLLSVLLGAFGFIRSTLGKNDPESLKRLQARAARKRLALAQKLLAGGSTADFYAEVERALSSFLEAKLAEPVAGLTRPELDAKMTAAKIEEAERKRVLSVFETCDLGRYAPGMGDASARRKAIDDAAAAMEAWP